MASITDLKKKADPIIVGKVIHDIRESKGLSMSQFANLVDDKGKAQSGTVANWEKGRNLPNNARLKKIAELGDMTVNELLNVSDPLKELNYKLIKENELLLSTLKTIEKLITEAIKDIKNSNISRFF